MKLTDSIYCKFLDGECFEHGVKCDNCLEKKNFDLLHLEKVNLEDSLLDPDKWEGKVDEEDHSPEFRNKGKQKKTSIDDMILTELHAIKLQGKWTTKKAVVALSDWFDFPSDLSSKAHYDDDNDTTYVFFVKSVGE